MHIKLSFKHNVLGQLTSQRNASASNITLSSWGHSTDAAQKQLYNALGQLVRSSALSTPTFPWGGTTSYAYDSRAQLAQESSTRGASYTHSFAYSNAGNITSWKGATRMFNSRNQEITGGAFLYDGAGNTTQMPNGNLATPGVATPTHKLIYSAAGQLAELRDANNAVIASYVYRGDGKRAWKELANGQRVYFYYAGENLIASTNGNDVSSLQLWGADGLVGTRSFNSTTSAVTKTYNLYDTQGNLAQTVNGLTGSITSQAAVNAWGEPLRDANGNAAGAGYGAKFGYVRDAESGFYLCTLRYYDPSGGRWLTRDPIGYAGGSNLYGYVGNDPVNMTDPSGLLGSRTAPSRAERNDMHDIALQFLFGSTAAGQSPVRIFVPGDNFFIRFTSGNSDLKAVKSKAMTNMRSGKLNGTMSFTAPGTRAPLDIVWHFPNIVLGTSSNAVSPVGSWSGNWRVRKKYCSGGRKWAFVGFHLWNEMGTASLLRNPVTRKPMTGNVNSRGPSGTLVQHLYWNERVMIR